jgi:hypothetical protein
VKKFNRLSKRRYLRPLKLGRRTKDFYVFDTETGIRYKDGRIQYILSARPENLIFGVVYGPNGFYKVIHSVDEFKAEFKKKRYKGRIIYAHNAEYDLSCIYSNIYLLDREAIFNGKFICCTNGNCTFADSYNILPASVKVLGEILGLPKGQLGDSELSSHINRLNEDIKYCYRDCKIVFDSLQNVFNDTEPSFTIGSLALKVFRSKYLKRTIKINEHSDRFFDALYGGRTEAFKIGKTNANVFDINSAYLSVMEKNSFPDPSKLRVLDTSNFPNVKGQLERALNKMLYRYEGMIKAKVKVNENEKLPVLPYRYENKLIFPCGEFIGAWTFSEIRYALQNSKTTILEIYEIVYAPAIESPYGQFARDVWKKRKDAQKIKDKATDYREKLFGNNLWGKNAQRAKEEFRFCTGLKEAKEFMREKKIKKGEIIEVIGGFFFRYFTDRLFNHTIACWAAYITAYVRIMLHKEMKKDGNDLVYCDTDSRFVTKSIDYNTKDQLGGWKKEEKKVTKIRALKDYVYTYFDKDKNMEVSAQMLKGVKKNAKQLDPEANVFLLERMIRTRESFRRTDSLPPGTFIKQIKTLSGDYLKRKVLPNGDTKPFIIYEGRITNL